MSEKPDFLTLETVDAALTRLCELWRPEPRQELLDTAWAEGRVLAEAVTSPADLPAFTRSAMDGFAVRAADTLGASPSVPAYLALVEAVTIGEIPRAAVGPGQAAPISTGAMLPPGADAVVMIEHTQPLGEGEIEVFSAVAPGEHCIQIGEDARGGELLLESGHRIRAQDIGALLAAGRTRIPARVRPTVGIVATGDELVEPAGEPRLGQVRDINTYILAAMLREAGARPVALGISRDDPQELLALARRGLESCDLLLLVAGSSVSARDHTHRVVAALGSPGVLVHGLAVKPGKPTILGLCQGKPVIGLPGNPVSAFLVAHRVVLPLLARQWMGTQGIAASVPAVLTASIASSTGREDLVPVRLSRGEGGFRAEPIFGKSNLISTLSRADGVVEVPLNLNGYTKGTAVRVTLLSGGGGS